MQPVSPPTPGEPPTRASESSRPAIERLKLSAYEQEALEIVLKARHLELEPAPEGKLLEGVDIAPLDVFEPAIRRQRFSIGFTIRRVPR